MSTFDRCLQWCDVSHHDLSSLHVFWNGFDGDASLSHEGSARTRGCKSTARRVACSRRFGAAKSHRHAPPPPPSELGGYLSLRSSPKEVRETRGGAARPDLAAAPPHDEQPTVAPTPRTRAAAARELANTISRHAASRPAAVSHGRRNSCVAAARERERARDLD